MGEAPREQGSKLLLLPNTIVAWVAIGLVLSSVAGICSLTRKPGDLVFEGKRLSFHFNRFLRGPVAEFSAPFEKLGAKALPFLEHELTRGDSVGSLLYAKAALIVPDTLLRRTRRPVAGRDRRARAADAIGLTGAAAKQSIPALIGAVYDKDSRVRLAALRALRRVGLSAEDVTSEGFARLLSHREGDMRAAAATMIGDLAGTKVRDFTPRFLDLLGDEDYRVRRAALYCLAKGKTEGLDAGPVLRASLADADAGVRVRAAQALWNLMGDSTNTVPILIDCLFTRDPETIRPALQTLAVMGTKADAARPVLARLLDSRNPEVQSLASKALEQIDSGGAGSAVLPESFARRIWP